MALFKKLDLYILRKFLGTFFLAIGLIMLIVIVFDISEKIEDFIDHHAPVGAIIFDYYLNFIPYFANLFSPLFCFISVIYFTSRMAYRTEIVAILSSGVSFNRLLFPYVIGACIIAGGSFYLNHYIIPHANKHRQLFENAYVHNPYQNQESNIHREVAKGTTIYFSNYNNMQNIGYLFSMDKFMNGERYYHLRSDYIQWDSLKGKWVIYNYFIRLIDGDKEYVRTGAQLDTALSFVPADFSMRDEVVESMNKSELDAFIASEKEKGSQSIPTYEVEKYKRTAFPFATIILTLIGVAIASRKVRGGIGLHLVLGIGLSFGYIVFLQIATTMSVKAGLPAIAAVWIPNVIFGAVALVLLRTAQK
ncbi:MAG TPA: LptF/LptG family permease [Bacteroidia bacterium]